MFRCFLTQVHFPAQLSLNLSSHLWVLPLNSHKESCLTAYPPRWLETCRDLQGPCAAPGHEAGGAGPALGGSGLHLSRQLPTASCLKLGGWGAGRTDSTTAFCSPCPGLCLTSPSSPRCPIAGMPSLGCQQRAVRRILPGQQDASCSIGTNASSVPFPPRHPFPPQACPVPWSQEAPGQADRVDDSPSAPGPTFFIFPVHWEQPSSRPGGKTERGSVTLRDLLWRVGFRDSE